MVGDRLWVRIAPLLPKRRRSPKGGRPPVPDRAALSGILFVLRSGIPWEMLHREMGCGSGMTCWRRLRDWNEAGVWRKLHQVLQKSYKRHRLSTGRVPLGTPQAYRQKRGRRDRAEPDGSR